MFDYPKMLYQYPGTVALQDGNYATHIIDSEAEEKQAIKDGWFTSPIEAKKNPVVPKPAAKW